MIIRNGPNALLDVILMIKNKRNEDGLQGISRSVEIKEGLWIVAVACIGLLFLVLLHQSGGIMAEFSESGKKDIPILFWVLVTIFLTFCISVFVLLKNSKPIEFRITAFLLTGVAPIVAILFIVFNLLNLEYQ